MAKRRRIGIIYRYDENWIGGTYYVQNLIAALHKLPEDSQPELLIFAESDTDFDSLKMITHYPFLERGSYVVKLPLVKRTLNNLARMLVGRNLYSVYNQDIDLVFPADHTDKFIKSQEFLYWIPDFQEHYLPDFFSEAELKRRKSSQQQILENGKNIVFSSQAALNDFNEIYPKQKIKKHVLPFAVTHLLKENRQEVREKFSIPDRFFICCNQFWKHKNHITVLKAVHILVKQKKPVFVVFTGKEYDERHPTFFNDLMQLVEDLDLREHVAFLGFIDREDQLALMRQSLAVIQPSLFEGWSTVVEDSKSLKLKIIASDIHVHVEQLQHYKASLLFHPKEEASLAESLLSVDSIAEPDIVYEKNVLEFATTFKKILDSILG